MTERQNDTKKRIVEEAVKLFEEKGYDAVKVQEICDAVGISKNTFYYYFETKESLLKEYLHVPYEVTTQLMEEILTADSPLEQLLMIVVPRMAHFEKIGIEITRQVIMVNVHRNNQKFFHKDKKHPFFDMEVKLIEKGQQLKEIRNQSDKLDLAKTMMTLQIGVALAWVSTEGKMSLKKMSVQAILNLFDPPQEIRKRILNKMLEENK